MSKTNSGSRLNIAFADERWQHVEQEWVKFWNGEQNRPMVNIALTDPDTPEVPEYRGFFPQYPLSMSAGEIDGVGVSRNCLSALDGVGISP